MSLLESAPCYEFTVTYTHLTGYHILKVDRIRGVHKRVVGFHTGV
jgi:hypothetical protein